MRPAATTGSAVDAGSIAPAAGLRNRDVGAPARRQERSKVFLSLAINAICKCLAILTSGSLKHDPEKCEAVFRNDPAQSKS
jgi:hypothetical protein